jgi:hypothetical protein
MTDAILQQDPSLFQPSQVHQVPAAQFVQPTLQPSEQQIGQPVVAPVVQSSTPATQKRRLPNLLPLPPLRRGISPTYPYTPNYTTLQNHRPPNNVVGDGAVSGGVDGSSTPILLSTERCLPTKFGLMSPYELCMNLEVHIDRQIGLVNELNLAKGGIFNFGSCNFLF